MESHHDALVILPAVLPLESYEPYHPSVSLWCQLISAEAGFDVASKFLVNSHVVCHATQFFNTFTKEPLKFRSVASIKNFESTSKVCPVDNFCKWMAFNFFLYPEEKSGNMLPGCRPCKRYSTPKMCERCCGKMPKRCEMLQAPRFHAKPTLEVWNRKFDSPLDKTLKTLNEQCNCF